ncbi:MAG TPA: uroporphyrinogen decarboxylase [Gemmatimonadaceae bacterium]|nr:uroporphyrinogen decarboxylase [Gemmatimonadaceae bacterium]
MSAAPHARQAAAPLLVRAAWGEPVERTPLWMMRQAGRLLPEYRALREQWSLLDISRQPDLAVRVTLQPLRRMPVDAAILFADIMTPLDGIGVALDIVEGVGPVIESPVRSEADVRALRPLEPEADVPYVMETLRTLRRQLDPDVALIGFAGAPFTLASYLIEGRPTRTFTRTKTMMYAAPALWHELMERLGTITISYLRAQIAAGADAVQLFDSWVGALAPDDYESYVAPHTTRIFAALRETTHVPLIHFGVGTATLLEAMRANGATVIGLDWRVPLDEGWARVGHDLAVQGNLDPAILFAPRSVISEKAGDVLRRAAGRPGHIFNLGHGILPGTPLDGAIHLVHTVREQSASIHAGSAPSLPLS